MTDRCRCGAGTRYAPDHASWHWRYRRGLAAGSARLRLPAEGIVSVDPGRADHWRLAHELTRHLSAEAGFDAPELGSCPGPEPPNVHLALVGRRAVGVAVGAMDQPICRWTPTDGGLEAQWEGWDALDQDAPHRPTVRAVWIAADHRGAGLGRQLVAAAGEALGAAPAELAWCFPLTDDGARLARAIQPGRALIGTNSVDPLLALRWLRLGITAD